MWHLHHYPLCPFSRKVRLMLGEKRIGHELALAYPWEQTPDFLGLNPAAQVPVLVWREAAANPVPGGGPIVLVDSSAILEYFEETVADTPLMGAGPLERAEVRRMIAWFDQKFYAEAGVHLLTERMWHRLFDKQPPNTTMLRHGLNAVDQHLKYVDHLVDTRKWIAGNSFSMADLAAAAHLSSVDYLGGIDWERHPSAKQWYMAIKSRKAFRPLLTDRMIGLAPPAHYEKLDF
jgi:glutathione S-transferase